MKSILDPEFNGMGGSELYRSQVVPEAFPHVRPFRLDNWPLQDLEMFCGGVYTPGYRRKEDAL